MGVLEFKPNSHFHSILDVYHSKFDQDENQTSIMWNNDPWWSANGNGVTYGNVGITQVNGVPVVTSGTLHGVGALNMLNEMNTREDKLFAAGWANTFQWGGIYTLKTDLSYSSAESTRTSLELQSAFASPRDIDFKLTTGQLSTIAGAIYNLRESNQAIHSEVEEIRATARWPNCRKPLRCVTCRTNPRTRVPGGSWSSTCPRPSPRFCPATSCA